MNKKLKAFTLVELLVSMAIIGVLLGLTLYGIGAAQRNARDAARKASIQDINAGIQDYYTIYGAYPGGYRWEAAGAGSTDGSLCMGITDPTACTTAGGAAVIVPLEGPASPINTGSTSSTGVGGAMDSDTTSDAAKYCINPGAIGGYALSVMLENGTAFSLGSAAAPGCYNDAGTYGSY